MCRHLGYLGRPRTLHELIYAPPYSLEHQSYAPRMSATCLVNADGYGAGWYPWPAGGDGSAGADGPAVGQGGAGGPVRFRRAQPIWTDVSFAEVARVITTRCLVAAVRSATVGFPVDESCAQPFRAGSMLFSHNGRVEDFAGVEGKLRELAGDVATMPDARAAVDSALLFALAVRARRAGAGLGAALVEVVTTMADLSPGRYNLLAADGESALAATRWGETLYVRESGGTAVIASEPDDDEPGWREVPDRSLVTVARAGPAGAPAITITPIEEAQWSAT
ncbi:MAG TPA: class II glutamine amidotransferase [Streptosporangiaceae bacterium]|nr:class II glutamine amidotransferase [Streptosporangiaceae bacterium]